jgi:5'-3' exonuclease
MGVAQLIGHLVKNSKIEIRDAKPGTYPEKISGMMIDFNDILHFCAQKTYLYGDYKATPAQEAILKKKSDSQLESQFIKYALARLDTYLEGYAPEDYFIVAVDGPVPLAKIAQQRMRRFESPTSTTDRFDNASLSPGTEFMEKVHLAIKNWFYDKAAKELLPSVATYSSYHEPGEGEHKMVDLFNKASEILYKTKAPDGLHLLCSQDGDLLMIGTSIPYKNVVHYKEDRKKEAETGEITPEFFMVDGWKKVVYKSFMRDKTEADYIVSFNMYGNDFIPKNPALRGAVNAHKDISDAYIRNGKRLVDLKTGKVNRANYLDFLGHFVDIEKANLDMAAASYNPKFMAEYNILVNNTKKNKNGRIEVDIEGFKKDWYTRAMKVYNDMLDLSCRTGAAPRSTICEKLKYRSLNEFKRDMFENYLEMLQWNLDYYFRKPVSWNFQYKFFFSPLISDIAGLDRYGDIPRYLNDEWRLESSCLRQLLMISHPAKVRKYIPDKYHMLADLPDITSVSPGKPLTFPDGYPKKDNQHHMYLKVLPLVSHDHFDLIIGKYIKDIPENLKVNIGVPDMYVKEGLVIHEELAIEGSEDDDIEVPGSVIEKIPGSTVRKIGVKNFEWVGNVS